MKNTTYWKKWIAAAGVRAIKTMAQTAIATIGTAALLGGEVRDPFIDGGVHDE